MKMQAFYQRLSVKPSKAHQRRLAGLTRISRTEALNAASGIEWFIWKAAETPPNA
jgi:hypothetical protein